MLRGLFAAALGMRHNQLKQDVSANNIANSTTPGYKQDKIVSKPFPEVMVQNMGKDEFGRPGVQELGSMTFGVECGESYTDFSNGPLQDTGGELDFALEGHGFFNVQYFDGISVTTKYTRDGSFKLDSQGNIVANEGGYVLGQNEETGEIGPMNIASGSIKVDSNGSVFVDSEKKYSFLISDFSDYNNLEKYGKNMISLNENSTEQPKQMASGEYTLLQGQLEQSNVDMTAEMVDMITNMRAYQANQRVLQSIDGTLGKAVNEVGSLK